MNKYRERIKFYADTPRQEKNKFFCYECSILQCKEFLYKFIFLGYNIRAAYYEKTEIDTGKVLENLKFDMFSIKDSFIEETKIEFINGKAILKLLNQ